VQGATNNQQQGGYTFPCSTQLPNFTLQIGSYKAVVPGKYMNYAPISAGSSTCFGGIQSDASIGFAIWGDVFLKSQYVVFDQTQSTPRLGFAAQA
jgi:aspergillopepsin I